MRTSLAFIIGAAALSVSGCATAEGAYGSAGLAYGYDSPYGFSCYGSPYGYGSGFGYGAYGYGDCGWYDGFFYPGFGNFVFDRHHHRHEMSMSQHDYFTRQARIPGGTSRVGLGSSGGSVPPSVSQPFQSPRNSFGQGNYGTRGGSVGGVRSGSSSHASAGARGSISGGSHGGGFHHG